MHGTICTVRKYTVSHDFFNVSINMFILQTRHHPITVTMGTISGSREQCQRTSAFSTLVVENCSMSRQLRPTGIKGGF